MVSQDSPSISNLSILHQFIVSNSIASQYEFRNQHFDPYAEDSIENSPYPQYLGLLPHTYSLDERMSRSKDLVHAHQLTDETHIDRDRQLIDLLGTSTEVSQQAQRLSLSLGSMQSRQRSLNSSNFISHGYTGLDRMANDISFAGNAFSPVNQSCSTLYGTESFAAAIGSSKYLKPAQSLLEEMVSVGGKDIDLSNQKCIEKLSRACKKGSSFALKAEFSNNEMLIEKHETYLNLVKLIALLEEVERHYEDYYHHMEKTVSSFEVIAGSGAGKCYTVLALRAMSKHFCSLRNAILFQIHVMRKKIRKNMPRFSSGLSDQEARHNRMSLQQLGIIQTSRQVCRPIRGLPETSVTIFRAWLFEHFLHPYVIDFPHNFKFAPKRCLLKIFFFSDILMTQKSLCWHHKQACQRTKFLTGS
ncbi:BEL1-like homeodomain protein 11 isoform X1 [Olea europaea var. sylvestris]|uniref:BEL1-like homeodomain protein 11 isoform X1 n=1 Tax=Olea europaea var. sylvestris TaxID=158386 RepID=UPI000C1D3401|nr:BEL1-like homeodomain protein 11 isoform X1 [Olea europaea var. sylvestris]